MQALSGRGGLPRKHDEHPQSWNKATVNTINGQTTVILFPSQPRHTGGRHRHRTCSSSTGSLTSASGGPLPRDAPPPDCRARRAASSALSTAPVYAYTTCATCIHARAVLNCTFYVARECLQWQK